MTSPSHFGMTWPHSVWPNCISVLPEHISVWPNHISVWLDHILVLTWPHFSMPWVHFSVIWLHFSMTWPHFNLTWPHFSMTWPHFSMTLPHFRKEAVHAIPVIDVQHSQPELAPGGNGTGCAWSPDRNTNSLKPEEPVSRYAQSIRLEVISLHLPA